MQVEKQDKRKRKDRKEELCIRGQVNGFYTGRPSRGLHGHKERDSGRIPSILQPIRPTQPSYFSQHNANLHSRFSLAAFSRSLQPIAFLRSGRFIPAHLVPPWQSEKLFILSPFRLSSFSPSSLRSTFLHLSCLYLSPLNNSTGSISHSSYRPCIYLTVFYKYQ